MRFLTDGTLGRLAKWLRILGYDTRHHPDRDMFQLMRIARSENRVVLTRDADLAGREGAKKHLVVSQILEDQLHEVLVAFALATDEAAPRCPVCNGVLEEVSKDRAWGCVPSYVFATQERFVVCPACDRFYWRGTHWEDMRNRLTKLLDRREG